MLKVKEELTEEDEHRRHRRRERNKVAATKCRNKKKARSANLMRVSAQGRKEDLLTKLFYLNTYSLVN